MRGCLIACLLCLLFAIPGCWLLGVTAYFWGTPAVEPVPLLRGSQWEDQLPMYQDFECVPAFRPVNPDRMRHA